MNKMFLLTFVCLLGFISAQDAPNVQGAVVDASLPDPAIVVPPPTEGVPTEGSPIEIPTEGAPTEGTPDVTQPTPEQTLVIPELTLESWELENQEGALVGTINVEGLLIEEGALLQAGEGELAGNEALLLNQEGALATEEVTLEPLDMNMGLVSEVAVSE